MLKLGQHQTAGVPHEAQVSGQRERSRSSHCFV
jgi:hypothetical protein